MKINEIETDISGYRIPRAKLDNSNRCIECGGTKDLQPCGEFGDPMCSKCRNVYRYLPCNKGCGKYHVKGYCTASAYTKE
jgi:hypothetical protein